MALQVGMKLEKEWEVTPQRTAAACGSGSLQVFGTPFLVMLWENTACELLQNELDEGTTTVGTSVEIQHTAATPMGAKVRAVVELTAIDRRALTFSVEAFDEGGSIGSGTHQRFIVESEKFLKKAQSRVQG